MTPEELIKAYITKGEYEKEAKKSLFKVNLIEFKPALVIKEWQCDNLEDNGYRLFRWNELLKIKFQRKNITLKEKLEAETKEKREINGKNIELGLHMTGLNQQMSQKDERIKSLEARLKYLKEGEVIAKAAALDSENSKLVQKIAQLSVTIENSTLRHAQALSALQKRILPALFKPEFLQETKIQEITNVEELLCLTACNHIQVRIYTYIKQFGFRSGSQMAKYFSCTRQHVLKNIYELEKKGLVIVFKLKKNDIDVKLLFGK